MYLNEDPSVQDLVFKEAILFTEGKQKPQSCKATRSKIS